MNSSEPLPTTVCALPNLSYVSDSSDRYHDSIFCMIHAFFVHFFDRAFCLHSFYPHSFRLPLDHRHVPANMKTKKCAGLKINVESFLTLEREAPAPQGKGWSIATAEEVGANPDLLPETHSGLGEWYIAALTDDMKVTGMSYGNTGERRDPKEGFEHVLYSYKRG